MCCGLIYHWNYSKWYLHEECTCKTSLHEDRQALFISEDAKIQVWKKKKPPMSDLSLKNANSVKWLPVANENSALPSRQNWKFHYQLVCIGVESGCCLFRVNFLCQLNIESVNSWNIQWQFSLQQRKKEKFTLVREWKISDGWGWGAGDREELKTKGVRRIVS